MRINSRRSLLFAALLSTAVLAAVGLMPRLAAENSNRTVAFGVEYRDISSLSVQNGLSRRDVLDKIRPLGVEAVSVQEFTGEDLALSSPMSLRYGAAGRLGLGVEGVQADRAVIMIGKDSKYAEIIYEYLNIKLPFVKRYETAGGTAIVLPGDMSDLKLAALVPDFTALDLCRENSVNVLFRLGPCPPSTGRRTADALHFLAARYPQIKNITPSGMIMAGYPDYAPLADVMKMDGMSFSQVEFVKQVGSGGFARLMAPRVLPLHSLTADEIISRTIGRRQISERFVRAVHERSVRIVMARPYDLQMGGRLQVFTDDLAKTQEALQARGYDFGWPEPMAQWPASFAGALACGLALVFCAWFYCVRCMGAEEEKIRAAEAVVLAVLAAASACAMWRVPAAARLAGGFCGALIAAEAAMTALENSKKPFIGAVAGLFIIIAGGLSIASFYGTTLAALRLSPFSGVKLTLLLPPLLLLMHDLKRRVHPESVGEIIQRPALWGELFLIGVMLLALLIMALRSDNVSNVPAWEVAFRDFMERALLVRPRTKEFLIGYPALVIYWYVVRKGWLPGYREALRIASALAFCSAVNTFCHFHTLLRLSLIRVVNGWWLGLLLGAVAVAAINYIALPLWKKAAREFFA